MVTKGLVRRLLMGCLASILLVSAPAQIAKRTPTPPKKRVAPEVSADVRLAELLASDWDYTMEQNPIWASQLGDRHWNDRWEDMGLASIEKRHQHTEETAKKLAGINRAQLSQPNQLNFDLFRRKIEEALEEYRFKNYMLPLNQREGIQFADEIAESLRFETVKDYEDWIARMRAFPVYMDQTIILMREGLRAGIKHPKAIMRRIPAQIDKQLVAPEASGFHAPFRRFPPSIPEADRKRLSAAALDAIATAVIPAYQRFKEFFEKEYLPGSYDEVGVWQYPDGGSYYAFTVRKYTTTNMTPEAIHQIGLAEVNRIRAEMDAIKAKTGFKGTMPEFFEFLRTDPRFYYKTGDELLQASRANAKRIDPLLVKLFKKLPRMPYGVEPIPANSAPDTTTAYYNGPAADGSRAGTYYVNLYKPDTRPKWEMMALTLHEAVPGHHLQIALAQEQGEIPNFRRYGYYSAFGEGWGLYAESLGDEMGLYDDPYSKFGQLTYEMWRAVRLVVDTGIHAKHWTRKQAIDYFMENTAKNELDVTNEVDRYIAWPGQALAYKIGELKIKQLRARAAKEFGDRFDVRDFHDVALGSGAVPLDVLENIVNAWIDAHCPKACELY